jgi:hypothetical protein
MPVSTTVVILHWSAQSLLPVSALALAPSESDRLPYMAALAVELAHGVWEALDGRWVSLHRRAHCASQNLPLAASVKVASL